MVFNFHFRNKAYNSVRWACLYSRTKERNEEVPFSMAIGNGELMHEGTHENSENEIRQ